MHLCLQEKLVPDHVVAIQRIVVLRGGRLHQQRRNDDSQNGHSNPEPGSCSPVNASYRSRPLWRMAPRLSPPGTRQSLRRRPNRLIHACYVLQGKG